MIVKVQNFDVPAVAEEPEISTDMPIDQPIIELKTPNVSEIVVTTSTIGTFEPFKSEPEIKLQTKDARRDALMNQIQTKNLRFARPSYPVNYYKQ